jgi:hypothetical protein
LLDRLVAVLFNPRPMIRKRDYYGPELRTASQLLRSPARDNPAGGTNHDVVML